MLLCDHIVFWARHFKRPEFTAGEIGLFIDAQKKWSDYSRRMTKHLCERATARMIGRIRTK